MFCFKLDNLNITWFTKKKKT